MRRIEVCCGSLSDVLAARAGGACRIELCQALEIGGLTPSPGLMKEAVRHKGGMKVNVLIRPRGGDFAYTPREASVMEADIDAARAAGADGVVIGALTPEGDIDKLLVLRLLARAEGMDVTFHRAFDEATSPFDALAWLRAAGVRRILTSGQAASAMEGAELLAQLTQAAGEVSIMPGGGVNPSNITQLQQLTGASEFHSTCSDKTVTQPTSRLFGTRPAQTSADIVRDLVES